MGPIIAGWQWAGFVVVAVAVAVAALVLVGLLEEPQSAPNEPAR